MATNDKQTNDSRCHKTTPVNKLETVYQNHIVVQQLQRKIQKHREENGGQYPLVGDGGYTQPEPYCVYVLECDDPNNLETVDERTKTVWGHTSKKTRAAFHSWKRFYIGSTSNVRQRVLNHLHGTGADFTQIFSPYELRELRWYGNYSDAQNSEQDVAVEYEQKYPDAFIEQI